MLTIGLSFHELERITKILDVHGVHYQVGGGDHSDDTDKTDKPKVKKARGNTSFYEIEIAEEEFKKLPESAITQLAELGVYPELEVPAFGPETSDVPKPLAEKKPMTLTNWIMLAVILTVLFFIVKKRVAAW